MNKLPLLEPTLFTTPKGEELVLLTLTRSEWETLHALLTTSELESEAVEVEKMYLWQEENLSELSERLDLLEAEHSPKEKQAWQDAVAKAKPARYVAGQGIIVQ